MSQQKQVQIKFVGHEVQKGVVMYKIQLYDTKESVQWFMNQRYSVMREIHKSLKEEYPDKIPEFPPKKWFGNTDEKFINQREKSLENYFSNCLKAISMDKSKTLKEFMLKQKVPGPIIPDAIVPNSDNTSSNNTRDKNPPAPVPKAPVNPVSNPAEEWKKKMEKIVSTVPFIDFVPFVSPEHNNQGRNLYNQITFQSKSKLLQNFQLPPSTTDLSEQAIQSAPVNVQFSKKMDAFADNISKVMNNHLSNLSSDFAAKPSF